MATDGANHKPNHLASVFDQLRGIMAAYADRLVVVSDEPDNFYLNTSLVMKNKQPLFFGAVQIKKRYVSYHLFPLYLYPEMVPEIDEGLRKRMQGKTCFNFTKLDDATLAALADLTRQGFARYEQEGLL